MKIGKWEGGVGKTIETEKDFRIFSKCHLTQKLKDYLQKISKWCLGQKLFEKIEKVFFS